MATYRSADLSSGRVFYLPGSFGRHGGPHLDQIVLHGIAVVIGYPSRPRVCVVLEALLEPDRGDSCRADLTLIINRIAGGSGLVSLSRPLVEDFTVNWIRPGRRVPVDDAAFEPGHAALPVREPDLVVGGVPEQADKGRATARR